MPRALLTRAAVAATLAGFAACATPETAVIVDVEALQGVGEPADLYVRFSQQNDNRETVLIAQDGPVFPAGGNRTTFVIRAVGRTGPAEVMVLARDSTQAVLGEGTANVVLVENEHVSATVRLHPSDFQINSASGEPPGKANQFFTTTASGRHVASDEKGNFVVVWEDSCPDGACRIFARLFDHLGTPRLREGSGTTDEFVVSASDANNYDMPAIAAQKDGSFVVVTKRYTATTPDKGNIYARAFTATGAANPQSPTEQRLSATADVERAGTPDIAALPGTPPVYVVVWQQKQVGFETTQIVGMRLSLDGKPIDGAPFEVASFGHDQVTPSACDNDAQCGAGQFCSRTTWNCQGIPAAPAVSPGPDQVGGFMVLWSQNGNLKGRAYANDATPLSGPVEIATPTGRMHGSDLSSLPYGYAVVWSDSVSTGTDTQGTSIRMRRFDVLGQPLEDPFSVNTSTAGNQLEPSVATRSDGHLLVVWATDQPTGETPEDPMGGIRARLVLGNGLPVGGDFRLNTTVPNAQMSPCIAPKATQTDEPPGFIVAFVDTSARGADKDGSGIRGRFYYPGTYSARDQQIGALCEGSGGCGANLYCASTQVGKRCVSTCQGHDGPCPNGGTCEQASDTAQFICTYRTAAAGQ